MNRHFHAFAFAATAITFATIKTADAGGCGGRGGFSIGFGGGRIASGAPYGGHNHGYPTPSQFPMMQSHPTYPQPGIPQQGFPETGFPQPGYAQDGFPMHGGFPQDGYPQQVGYEAGNYPQQGSYPQQVGSAQPSAYPPQNGNPQQGMAGSRPPINQTGMAQQQPVGSSNGMHAPSVSPQGIRQTNGNFAPQGAVLGNPNQQPASTAGSNNGAPQNSNGNVNAGLSQNAGAALTGEPTGLSALQMLASISGEASPAQSISPSPMAAPVANQPALVPAATGAEVPEFTAAASPTAGSHVGTWAVSLPGNQTIVLTLSDDSSFRWNASKDGKSSSFQGQYRLEGNRLTLVRSNDLQQMAGSWTGAEANFTFKLDGATTSGLAFARN